MITKTVEVRDRATTIPVLAIKLEPTNEADRYLLERAGFGSSPRDQAAYIYLVRIEGGQGKATCCPYDWSAEARTMPEAHTYLLEHFDELKSGDVVDVEYVLGETQKPKLAERLTHIPAFLRNADDERGDETAGDGG